MTNLDIMTSGVLWTSDFKSNYTPGCSQTKINSYSTECLFAVCFSNPSEWSHAFTRQNNLRNDMLSLRTDDIKNEFLKHAVNITAYNRLNNGSEASYLSTIVDVNTMTDDRIAAAISNAIENGLIEESYLLLDNPEVMKSCIRSFVSTVNDPLKKDIVPNMMNTDVRAHALIDELNVYYARWKNVGNDDYSNSSYGGK